MTSSPLVSSSVRWSAFLALAAFACGTPREEVAEGPAGETTAQRPEPEAEPEPTPDELLQQRAEALQLEAQKRTFLIERHLDLARQHLDALRFEDAEAEARTALALDPDHLEAKDLLARIGALLGRRPEEIETYRRDLEQRWNLRQQQLRAEAEDAIERGRLAMERGEFDRAAQEFHTALLHVRWAPTGFEGTDVEARAQAGLDEARSRKAAEEGRTREERERATFERLQAEEQAAAARRRARLDTMLAEAVDAFEGGRYKESVEISDALLREDPRNERALELRASAFKASLEQYKRDALLKKREQFRRWREEILENRIPYTAVVTNPDPDVWAEITAKRAAREDGQAGAAESEETRRMRQEFARTQIPGLQVRDETDLSVVIGYLRSITGLPIVVDPVAVQAVDEAGAVFTFDIAHPISAEAALRLILEYSQAEITYAYRHDVVLVTTREKARGRPVVRNHDVQDLTFGLTSFVGPSIGDIQLPGGGLFGEEEGAGIFGGVDEQTAIVDPDQLVTMIKESVAPGTWDEEGRSIEVLEGNLIVVHDAAVQDEIGGFLDDLREFSSSLVTIEAKFLTVSENFLQSIGVDFRGLGGETGTLANLDDVTNGLEDMTSLALDNLGPGLGTGSGGNPSSGAFFNEGNSEVRARTENFFETALGRTLTTEGGLSFQFTLLDDLELSLVFRAIEKEANIQIVNSQILSVHNTQRSYLTVVNQVSYVQDFDVEVAQAAFIADPQINVIADGVVLDIRPTIHHDRRYITLELQPTVATLQRPIPTFTTSLSGLSIPVTLQLPELRVQSAFTTAVVPDGGSILIGGLKEIRNVERRASIPILEDIPLISSLFKLDEYDDENQTLMVLIRAWITDVKDEARKLAKAR